MRKKFQVRPAAVYDPNGLGDRRDGMDLEGAAVETKDGMQFFDFSSIKPARRPRTAVAASANHAARVRSGALIRSPRNSPTSAGSSTKTNPGDWESLPSSELSQLMQTSASLRSLEPDTTKPDLEDFVASFNGNVEPTPPTQARAGIDDVSTPRVSPRHSPSNYKKIVAHLTTIDKTAGFGFGAT